MTDQYYLKAQTIVGEDQNYQDRCLLIENGKIIEVTDKIEPGTELIDYSNATIVPGLIDLHIHGRDGCDVMDANHKALSTISSSLAKHGITGFLATTVTSSWQETLDALDAVGHAATTGVPGAAVFGGYSEGLFFTNDHKGAHDEQYFLPLTVERVDQMIDATHGQLKVIALAPEVDGACDVIKHIRSRNVQVMLGHTDATYDQTVEALNAGASGGVHVFNGMRGIHHREPGCTGAVLMENASVEVIADGVHLHPAILKMICKLKDTSDINLISDCINAGGMPDGTYRLGKLDVSVNDGIARTKSGSLAGSTLTLERAVQNMMSLADVDFRDAVHMASLSPAKFLGIEKCKGSIKEGKDADLAVISDSGEVMATIRGGKIIYSKN